MRLFSSPQPGSWLQTLPLLSILSCTISAIPLDSGSTSSARNALEIAAKGGWSQYTGYNPGDTAGNLPAPYYWWEAGAFMMTFIDYWYYTQDDTYVANVTSAMLHQMGPQENYITPNQSSTEGNDDQGFWGLAAMDAAELKYPNPPEGNPSWTALAQGVFNNQAPRWDTTSCGGGLKWQIYVFKQGYNYKNTVSNGCFFSLGSRLYRYTANDTFSHWAEKTWDWVSTIGLLTPDYHIWDGTDDTENCTSFNHIEWTYEYGLFLHGAANMWNVTGDPKWRTRVDGLLGTIGQLFFKGGTLFELACEQAGQCGNDQRSFKGYLARWMAATTQLAPWTHDTIMGLLRSSAAAAASQCDGGPSGNMCGYSWLKGAAFDNSIGPGEQMNAMQIFGAQLIDESYPPVTLANGGISKDDPNAGGEDTDPNSIPGGDGPPTAGGKAGAAFLTILILGSFLCCCVWMAM